MNNLDKIIQARWPESWANEKRKVATAEKILSCCVNLGIQNLCGIDRGIGTGWMAFSDEFCAGLKRLVDALRDYGRHDAGCSAEIDEAKYRCRCGWKRERELIFGE